MTKTLDEILTQNIMVAEGGDRLYFTLEPVRSEIIALVQEIIKSPQHCPYSHCKTDTCKHWEELKAKQLERASELLGEIEQ